jgi:hypothetical protein
MVLALSSCLYHCLLEYDFRIGHKPGMALDVLVFISLRSAECPSRDMKFALLARARSIRIGRALKAHFGFRKRARPSYISGP